MSSKERVLLPNGLYAYEDTRRTARILHHQVGAYFDQGLIVKPGMTVLDVGANMGVFALEVLHRTAGNLRLFCFEPAPITFDCLRRAVTEQFPEAQVELLNVGVASSVGEATFFYRPRASAMSSFSEGYVFSQDDVDNLAEKVAALELPEEYWREAVPSYLRWMPRPVRRALARYHTLQTVRKVIPSTCSVTTIDHVVQQHGVDRIDLLKIDVEGSEWDVLQGIGASTWPKIHSMAIEVHDLDHRLEKTKALLREQGFATIHVDQEDVFRGTSIYGIWACR